MRASFGHHGDRTRRFGGVRASFGNHGDRTRRFGGVRVSFGNHGDRSGMQAYLLQAMTGLGWELTHPGLRRAGDPNEKCG